MKLYNEKLNETIQRNNTKQTIQRIFTKTLYKEPTHGNNKKKLYKKAAQRNHTNPYSSAV